MIEGGGLSSRMSGLVVRMIVVAAGVLNVHDDGRVSRDGRDAPIIFGEGRDILLTPSVRWPAPDGLDRGWDGRDGRVKKYPLLVAGGR